MSKFGTTDNFLMDLAREPHSISGRLSLRKLTSANPSSLRSKRFRAERESHFLALVSFLARPKPRISFLGLFLLRNSTETLATQAKPERQNDFLDILI